MIVLQIRTLFSVKEGSELHGQFSEGGRCSLQWVCVYVQVFECMRARTRSVIKYRLQMLPKKTTFLKT